MPVQVQLLMPKFGMSMVEGTVVSWFKGEGERIRKGEPLLVIETDKVTVEVEAPWAGVLQQVLAQEGEDVPVGQSVGVLLTDEEGAQNQVALTGKPRRGARRSPASSALVSAAAISQVARPANLDISPIALKIATERGVDVSRIKGTGPAGRITKEDVLQASEQGIPDETENGELEPLEVIPLRGVRRTISERMHLSRQTAAHFTLSMEADMTEAMRFRERLSKVEGEAAATGPSLNAMVVMAVASALDQHRNINCSVVGSEIRIWKQINVGVAVATDRGVIVPVVRDADKKSLDTLSSLIRDLADRAREGTLEFADVGGGTFTVTNLGSFGVDTFTPVINQPESAILGVGRVAQKPVAVNGEVIVKWMMPLSLSIDHRVIDGAPGARFLNTVKDLLEAPEWMGLTSDG
ncbi:MAG: dihydrolipoamide acetyltransferase family protein [Dehalococcoidia bacterium]|nr:dihydrolipoamide acetyltransferase family protein [Dehalococcoidia bacterium]